MLFVFAIAIVFGFITQIRYFSIDMCSCQDAACASQVRNRFQMWQRRQGDATESSQQAAEPALERMASCLADISSR